jgi:hypothetical protein
MTPSKPPTNRGAVAGSLLVATIVLCAAIGFGAGALIGGSADVILGLAGLFAGVVAGILVVRGRFLDL